MQETLKYIIISLITLLMSSFSGCDIRGSKRTDFVGSLKTKICDVPIHFDNIYFKSLLFLAVVLFLETLSITQYHWATIQGFL